MIEPPWTLFHDTILFCRKCNKWQLKRTCPNTSLFPGGNSEDRLPGSRPHLLAVTSPTPTAASGAPASSSPHQKASTQRPAWLSQGVEGGHSLACEFSPVWPNEGQSNDQGGSTQGGDWSLSYGSSSLLSLVSRSFSLSISLSVQLASFLFLDFLLFYLNLIFLRKNYLIRV